MMDIWKWVEQTQVELREAGQLRLADLLDRIPEYEVDDMHAQLDAAMPEALALARQLELGHVEVYLRHWNLRSRVLTRMQVREYLPEAVSLLEFAHREENASCPQSICVTQDLAVAYRQRDYAGFVDERIAVCEETLAKIDPTWSCHHCVSLELVEAMADGGDPEGALARLDVLCDELRDNLDGWRLEARLQNTENDRVALLAQLGRLDEALEVALRTLEYRRTSTNESRHTLNQAALAASRIHAMKGNGEESLALLENIDELMETPAFYEHLVDTLVALVECGALENDWRLGARLWTMQTKLAQNGVMRLAVDVAWEAAKLAHARGASESALRALDALELASEELVVPHDVLASVGPLSEKIEAARGELVVPQTEEALIEVVGQDPEADLELFLAFFEANPDSDAVFGHIASAYEALALRAELLAHLRAGYDAAPDGSRLMRLASTLARLEGPESVREFAQSQFDGEWGYVARYARAQYGEGGPRERIEDAKVVLETDPNAPVRMMIAMAHRELGEHEEALRCIDAFIEVAGEENPGLHWDRMTEATALGRWDIVRESAAILEFPVRSESGPIEDQYGYCKLRMTQEPGQPEWWAMRTGPTSARLVTMSSVGEPQRLEDLWAFDVEPLGPPPEEGDEDYTYVYGAVAQIEDGPYGPSFSIDGPRPSEEAMERFAEIVDGFEGVWSHRAPETYALTDAQTGDEVPAVYAVFAVPETVDLAEVDAALTEFNAGLELPVQWYALARALGGEEATPPHAAVIERFGIRLD